MTYLLRFEGEGEQIDAVRERFVAEHIEVSESHMVNLDSKQLSTPWTSPEIIEFLKFVTVFLQTATAGLVTLKMVRDLLRGPKVVLVERKDIGAQLKITKDTTDSILKEFSERDG
jgi:hypothetical protein